VSLGEQDRRKRPSSSRSLRPCWKSRERARRFSSKTFAALSVRNFRLYFIGQLISVSGTWMQSVAQAGWCCRSPARP